MPDNYLAITIGPLDQFLQQARKTRELWSVSFTFSRLMKCLVDEFSKKAKPLSPHRKVAQRLHGAGVFPDRCFFQLPAGILSETEIKQLKIDAFSIFEKETGISGGINAYQVYIVQAEIPANPIGSLNNMLDALELQQQYSPVPTMDWDHFWNNANKTYSKNFFQNLYNWGYDPKDALLPLLLVNNQYKIRRFPSIPEIATHELSKGNKENREKYWSTLGYLGIDTDKEELFFTNLKSKTLDDELDDDDEIINALKGAYKEEFLFRHKYFSVVQADGDNVSKLIAAIEDAKGDIEVFSKALNGFAETAARLLVNYGGFPVYIGGDDLLFFAPLANSGLNDNLTYEVANPTPTHGNIFGNNLFFLLSKLNSEFINALQPITSQYPGLPPVSLSFGVMTGYYKQPLREIQKTAKDLLFKKAKKQPLKNFIAMKVQKHSGQSFDLGFTQHGPLYECFLRLSYAAAEKDTNFLNSLMYKLDDQKKVLEQVAHKPERLTLFFEENFNEAGHEPYKPFFKAAAELITQVFSNYPDLLLDEKTAKIYAALRFVHFINAKDVSN
jgi:CRISPR-associated protein Cmr2